MTAPTFVKAGTLTIVLVVISIGSWEFYLRNKGIKTSYDDDEALWSDKRSEIYASSDKATVFIGSSRNKYDIDIPTWKKLTGENVIQLAHVGSTPLPVLDDLANDESFKGKLVIDVTEVLFFSMAPPNRDRPDRNLAWFKKRTPAQRFSFQVNHLLESQLVFLDKDNLSLNALLNNLHIPSRPGVFVFPDFPMEFERVTFQRQNYMTDRFVADTNLQNQVKGVWAFIRKITKGPPLSGAPLDSLLNTVKSDVDKINARGGKVIFVRSPSSGPFLMGEKMGYPRPQYWEKILSVTNSQGIHFEDYPAIAHFECPEFSHLKPSDAVIYTTNLIDILEKEKGWVFPNKAIGIKR